jgi:hypothetical protein
MTTQELSHLPHAAEHLRPVKLTQPPAPSRMSRLTVYAPPLVALPAVGLGIAGLLGAGPSFLRRHPIVSAALACGGMVALVKSQFDRFLVEHPEYEVVDEMKGLEIRLYPARNVAETTVHALTFEEARTEGFRRLASYIFGDNVPGEKLAMTAPVNLSRESAGRRGERLAMTTPVTVSPSESEAGYVMRFHMPKDRDLASLPTPKDPRINLRRLPEDLVAALRFRGSYDPELITAKESELLIRVQAAGLTPIGEPTFAGYDSPAALPFLRRVEVWTSLG